MKPQIGVTEGMGGWYAVLYDTESPIQTGIGRYATREEAEAEARDWALSDEHYTDFDQTLNLALAGRCTEKGAKAGRNQRVSHTSSRQSER